MAYLDVVKVVAATRRVLEKRSKAAVNELTPRQVRALVEQDLGAEPGTLSKKPHKAAVKVTALDFVNGLRTRFGVRSYKDDFGQCNACGSWVKLVNLTAHAEKRCKARLRKENTKYWSYVASGGGDGEGSDDGDGEEER